MRVIIESPYSPGSPENIEYARRCLFDSLLRGESPFASHLLYTQVLDDTDSKQRCWYDAGFGVVRNGGPVRCLH